MILSLQKKHKKRSTVLISSEQCFLFYFISICVLCFFASYSRSSAMDNASSVEILATADIRAIYTNGGKAFELYDKYIYPVNGIKAQKLPSTSPANAGYSLERLKEAWMEIVKTLIM